LLLGPVAPFTNTVTFTGFWRPNPRPPLHVGEVVTLRKGKCIVRCERPAIGDKEWAGNPTHAFSSESRNAARKGGPTPGAGADVRVGPRAFFGWVTPILDPVPGGLSANTLYSYFLEL